MPDFPIADPVTGEVLANDPAERLEVMQDIAAEIIDLEILAATLPELRAKLEALMLLGESVTHRGHALTCEIGSKAARQVNRQEVLVHAEQLAPLGLAPREEVSTVVKYPGVAQFTAHRSDLALAGLNINTFLLEGGEARPTVRLYRPEEK